MPNSSRVAAPRGRVFSTRTRAWARASLLIAPALAAFACAEACGGSERPTRDDDLGATPSPPPAVPSGDFARDAAVAADADGSFAACASAAIEARRTPLPVDIVWVVDNSSSMQPAVAEVQAGLNAFAELVGKKGLDYKVVVLSLRGDGPLTVGGKMRYPVCVPPPLGGADCGNGPRFFHASVDVQSTQPLEQILGTLDQTAGYAQGSSRGSEPWKGELRATATKSIVLVTDDNSRFPAPSFELFPGGPSPYTGGLTLPPGLLHPSRGGAFQGYSFSAIYGWGNAADPSYRCTYPDGSKPTTSGSEYTALVAKTGGARAQICDGSAAWKPFFDAVATAVVATARLDCELPIPAPDGGALDPSLVNVRVTDPAGVPFTVPRVESNAACGASEGWYYDAPTAAKNVVLCPTSCERAQSKGGAMAPKLDVLFGCATIVR